MTLLVGSHDP